MKAAASLNEAKVQTSSSHWQRIERPQPTPHALSKRRRSEQKAKTETRQPNMDG